MQVFLCLTLAVLRRKRRGKKGGREIGLNISEDNGERERKGKRRVASGIKRGEPISLNYWMTPPDETERREKPLRGHL